MVEALQLLLDRRCMRPALSVGPLRARPMSVSLQAAHCCVSHSSHQAGIVVIVVIVVMAGQIGSRAGVLGGNIVSSGISNISFAEDNHLHPPLFDLEPPGRASI